METPLNNIPLPPPPPRQNNQSTSTKILFISILCVVLMIGVGMVYSLTSSRIERNQVVAQEIGTEWGNTSQVGFLTITPEAGGRYDRAVSPDTFNCSVSLDAQTRHRNIYETEVYTSLVRMNGSFNTSSVSRETSTLIFTLGIKTNSVSGLQPLTINGKQYQWDVHPDHLRATVPVDSTLTSIDYSTSFTVKGTTSLFVARSGIDNNITFTGLASNPSFRGSALPNTTEIDGKRFTAKWEHIDCIRPSADEVVIVEDDSSVEESNPEAYGNTSLRVTLMDTFNEASVGAEFLVGVDRYQKVTRALKYSFIFIVLTFVCVFFSEVITRRRIPLLNYFLIGAALVLFYTLLLAFAEQTGFGIAYLIAAVMTIGLITIYMWRMLSSGKVGLTMCAILTVMYASCYIMLCVSTFALLLGSLLLFAALAAMMYGSILLQKRSN